MSIRTHIRELAEAIYPNRERAGETSTICPRCLYNLDGARTTNDECPYCYGPVKEVET